jgi:hypothetical protein
MIILFYLFFFVINVYSICNQIKTRKEIRNLSNSELNQFTTLFRGLYNNDNFQKLVNKHADQYNLVHNTPIFLPFHRVFINNFEQQFMSNVSFGLPYLDWTLDSNNVKNSIVFSDKYFGKNDANGNIIDSKFRGVIKRNVDITNGYTDNIRNAIINSFPLYSNMSFMIELGIHGLYHSKLHEVMDSIYSPMDPIFFLHHSFIDKLWLEWSNIKLPNKVIFDNTMYHKNINANSYLPGYQLTSKFALNISNFCYTYQNDQNDQNDQNGQNGQNNKGNLPELASMSFLIMHNFTKGDVYNLQDFNTNANNSNTAFRIIPFALTLFNLVMYYVI